MRKKGLLFVVLVAVSSIAYCSVASDEERYHSSIMSAGDEMLSVHVNGKDMTDEYINLEQRTKEYIARFLNRECSEIQFKDYCMLEMDGMTVEAEVEGIDYTFLLNIEGELLSVARSDGKKLRE